MPKRKRLLNSLSKLKSKSEPSSPNPMYREVRAARGRLMGALLEALDGPESSESESDEVSKLTRYKKKQIKDTYNVEEDEMANRHAYVLKLFDRSVDLSQFSKDSPLYPICRAWIMNNPKMNYSDIGNEKLTKEVPEEEQLGLPPPEGRPVSKIPKLLPEQEICYKDQIDLDYEENPPPPIEDLIAEHRTRWVNVRHAWLKQAAKVEARYQSSQNKLYRLSAQ